MMAFGECNTHSESRRWIVRRPLHTCMQVDSILFFPFHHILAPRKVAKKKKDNSRERRRDSALAARAAMIWLRAHMAYKKATKEYTSLAQTRARLPASALAS